MILKYKPEDFIVEEILDLNLKKTGNYSYFLLQKTNLTTHKAIELFSNLIGLPSKRINFSGTKDKKAVTKQYISVNSLPYNLRKDYFFDNLELTYLGQGDLRLNLGTHKANKFKIVLRNLDEKKEIKLNHFPNYFGSQRFSLNNIEIGRLIIQNKLKEAANLIHQTNVSFSFESKFKENNYIGAIQQIHSKIMRLYLHSFQSYLWNIAVSSFLKNYSETYNLPFKEVEKKEMTLIYPLVDINMKIGFPLIGFDFEDYIEEYETKLAPEFKDKFRKAMKIIFETLNFYGINSRMFILKSFPNFTLETEMRSAIVNVSDFKYIWGEDEYHINKKKLLLVFTLEKSSYATTVIESIFS